MPSTRRRRLLAPSRAPPQIRLQESSAKQTWEGSLAPRGTRYRCRPAANALVAAFTKRSRLLAEARHR